MLLSCACATSLARNRVGRTEAPPATFATKRATTSLISWTRGGGAEIGSGCGGTGRRAHTVAGGVRLRGPAH